MQHNGRILSYDPKKSHTDAILQSLSQQQGEPVKEHIEFVSTKGRKVEGNLEGVGCGKIDAKVLAEAQVKKKRVGGNQTVSSQKRNNAGGAASAGGGKNLKRRREL